MRLGRVTTLAAAVLLAARAATAQTALSGDTIHITRATGPITVDGDLSDAAWRDATRVEKWYEKKPGDNPEPKVKNVGYLTFDDNYLYAAFEFDDPNPSAIRAPFADRDNINGNANDYGGLLLDARNTGSNSVLSSPRRGTRSTTRSSTTRRTRIRRRTSSGIRRRRSPNAAGRWRSASRSRPSGTRTSTRRPGG